jgi:predicted secreted protein
MSDFNTPMPPPPPGYGAAQPGQTPPPNYLVWAILSTLFCCLPFGIASIVFAAQVNSKWAMGDVNGALESSAKAKKFAIIAAIAGVIVAVLYVILIVAIGVGTNELETTGY